MNYDPAAFAAYTARVTEATQEAHEATKDDVRAVGTRHTTARTYSAITRALAAEHTRALSDLILESVL
jgi:hypothetical protein